MHEFERKSKDTNIIFALVICAMDDPKEKNKEFPKEAQNILVDFSVLHPKELPNKPSPLCDIQPAIDLVPIVSLLNLKVLSCLLFFYSQIRILLTTPKKKNHEYIRSTKTCQNGNGMERLTKNTSPP